jgi:hypothetical protein
MMVVCLLALSERTSQPVIFVSRVIDPYLQTRSGQADAPARISLADITRPAVHAPI